MEPPAQPVRRTEVMTDCPTQSELDQFSKRHLSASLHAALKNHLDGCLGCRRIVASLQGEVTLALDDEEVSSIKTEWVSSVLPELEDHPRYRILELLSTGGMGALYKAEHRFLERFVVLKMIR